jgi:hypothetical protein
MQCLNAVEMNRGGSITVLQEIREEFHEARVQDQPI